MPLDRTPIMLRLALIIYAVVGTALASAGTYNAVISIGDPMPQFENLPSTQGDTVSATDFDQADILILVSMTNHCPWSNGAEIDTIALTSIVQPLGVEVVAFNVNLREDDLLPAMINHATIFGYNFPYLFDESQELGRQLGVSTTPEYFVFNKERRLAYMGLLHNSPATLRNNTLRYTEGEPTVFYVEDAIHATLQGLPVAIPETKSFGCMVEYAS